MSAVRLCDDVDSWTPNFNVALTILCYLLVIHRYQCCSISISLHGLALRCRHSATTLCFSTIIAIHWQSTWLVACSSHCRLTTRCSFISPRYDLGHYYVHILWCCWLDNRQGSRTVRTILHDAANSHCHWNASCCCKETQTLSKTPSAILRQATVVDFLLSESQAVK